MIEVYIESEKDYTFEGPPCLLYVEDDLFIWAHLTRQNKWARLRDYPAIFDIKLTKIFEIEL